ncbi:MAG: translation initiation factor IF-3 [Patescibacteria group bacterium]
MNQAKRYKTNERIFARELRIISSKGENLGVMQKFQALDLARKEGLDLVEIGPKAIPPVAKILDFKKFLYDERKNQSQAKAKSKQSELKEFVFGPNIGQNDLELKIGRAREFLERKDRVKFTIKFSGRQIAYPALGFEKINKAIHDLTDIAKQESEPRLIGKMISTTLLPR